MSLCEYKILYKGQAVEKITRNYKRLTGEDVAPPVDTMFFVKDVPETQVYKALGITIENGFHKLKARHTMNVRTVGILIGVRSYAVGGMHTSHALAAVKHRDTLYAMNPWGIGGLRMDANVFKIVKERYGCAHMHIYNGANLQQGDPYGVCAGYSSNFVLEMFIQIYQNKLPIKISQKMYDTFVYTALKTRGICFGTKCVKNMTVQPQKFWAIMEENLQAKQVSPTNLVSIVQNKRTTMPMLRGIGKNYEIKIPTKLKKQEVIDRLTQVLRKKTVANLENINFKNASPPKPDATLANLKKIARIKGVKGYGKFTNPNLLAKYIKEYKPKPDTLTNLKKLARDKGIKGYSKFTNPNLLAKYIQEYKPVNTLTNLKKFAKDTGIKGYTKFKSIEELYKYIVNYRPASPKVTLANLQKIAKNRKLKGYTKYTKKENLAKFIQQHENK